jgi:glycosyltransferase involved in cell wall biosynthesis
MNNHPQVSVVVVTRNRRSDLEEAIESLRQQTYDNIEIVIVDNGSVDDTVAVLREHYADIQLVTLEQNTGPYHGRNVGAAASQGDILFFLDDDTSMERTAVAEIVDRFTKQPALGVIVGRIIVIDTGETVLFSKLMTSPDQECYLGDMVAEGITAIRRDLFDLVGRWPAHYFRAQVGKDLSYRVIEAGYNILYLPTAIGYDKASPLGDFSRKQIEMQKTFYVVRNQLWITWKYLPLPRAAGESIAKICYYFWESLRNRALHLYVGGLVAALVTMPRILLRERRPVSRKTLQKIDYLSYGALVTNPAMLESFTPLSVRVVISRKMAALFSKGAEAKAQKEAK